MDVRAQFVMVMNLDKCIGCHTCSITCKQTWTNREGVEYAWFNNVETRPGAGYPHRWEDQDRYKGGWALKGGRLEPRLGGKLKQLINIFYNPYLPTIDDYYEPWTYDYERLVESPLGESQPVARPRSLLSGRPIEPKRSLLWDADLAGGSQSVYADPNLADPKVQEAVKAEYERTFMFYLPRICNHCLVPTCVGVCPSGAAYKREEDGIVLIDQEKCQGWRFCVTGCPYKKVYYNWKTHKSEKCTFCYPRIEAGLPTICAETCVGKIRYIGVIFYDRDKVMDVATTPDPKLLAIRQRDEVYLDPFDPEVIKGAKANGIPDDWIAAAQRSPAYKLIKRWKVALPLHPEYRTLPNVWYIPPLNPILGVSKSFFVDLDSFRIPLEYLASLFAAGNVDLVKDALRRLLAMRCYMRGKELGEDGGRCLDGTGLTPQDAEDMYRLLAIAKYEERFVIPKAHKEYARSLFDERGVYGFDFSDPPAHKRREALAACSDPEGLEGGLMSGSKVRIRVRL